MRVGKLDLFDTIDFGEDITPAFPLAADEVEIQVHDVDSL